GGERLFFSQSGFSLISHAYHRVRRIPSANLNIHFHRQFRNMETALQPTSHRSPIPVAIVDDDAGLRASLRLILEHASEFGVVGSYADAGVALQGCAAANPQLVLM